MLLVSTLCPSHSPAGHGPLIHPTIVDCSCQTLYAACANVVELFSECPPQPLHIVPWNVLKEVVLSEVLTCLESHLRSSPRWSPAALVEGREHLRVDPRRQIAASLCQTLPSTLSSNPRQRRDPGCSQPSLSSKLGRKKEAGRRLRCHDAKASKVILATTRTNRIKSTEILLSSPPLARASYMISASAITGNIH